MLRQLPGPDYEENSSTSFALTLVFKIDCYCARFRSTYTKVGRYLPITFFFCKLIIKGKELYIFHLSTRSSNPGQPNSPSGRAKAVLEKNAG